MFFFFFNDTATTEIYTLSLHDALPISPSWPAPAQPPASPPTPTVGAFSFAAASLDSALFFASSTSSSLTFRISTQHRATWPSATSSSEGSGSTVQRATTNGHRGWNLHPGGGCERSGGMPLIETSRSFRDSSTRGTERSSDHV